MLARNQPLVFVLAAFASGIIADHNLDLAPSVWLAIALTAVLGWLALWLLRRHLLSAITLLIAIATIGGAWRDLNWQYFPVDEISLTVHEIPAPICIEATARSGDRLIAPPPPDPLRPPQLDDQTRVAINVTAVRNGDQWQPVSGHAMLLVSGDLLGIHSGDRLRIFGRISTPSPAGNPGETDYADLARSHREMAVVRAGFPQCVEVLESGSGWSPTRWIDDLRTRGDQLLKNHLSHERAGLAAAVLMGSRDELDSQRIEPFLLTGSIHVLVVAGLHVGILAYLLFKALDAGFVPRRWALFAVALITLLYALITQAEAPVLRAMILTWIVCGSSWLGRGGLGLNSLALAGLVILAINPSELFHVGAQLSFLSVAGLIAFGYVWRRREKPDPLARLIARSRPWPTRVARRLVGHLREATLVGLTIWLVTMPLVMARFHLLTPAAILLNPLLLVPLTLAMGAGFGVLMLGWLAPPVGDLFGRVCDWSLSVLEWAVARTAEAPGGHFWVPGPRDWWLAVLYLGLAYITIVAWPVPTRRWRLALLAGWCGVGFSVAWLLPAHGRQLDCTFVSVGHGCAVVVELPGGRVILSDAGRLGSPQIGAREISGYLWSRGLAHIDAIVLSHNDTDHYNAVPELLRRFSVGAIYVSPVMFNRDPPSLLALRRAIASSGVPLREISAGDQLISGDETTITALHPPPQGMGASENADSVVLDIRSHGRRILLTGDLAPPGLDAVVAIPTSRYDVTMAPHHGSATSRPTEFAAWTKSHYAIISGDLSHDSHVAVEAYQAAGSTVLNTATAGAVHIGVDENGNLTLDCYRLGDRW